jgi:nucleoid DNA-binding protein
MALTKSQLVDAIAAKASVEKKTAETMLDCLAQLESLNSGTSCI